MPNTVVGNVAALAMNSLTFGGIGSAMANSGSARLANVLRYASTGLSCGTSVGAIQ